MAQKKQIVLVDDLNGRPAKETVSLQLDGVTYGIDLTAAHANELRAILKPYLKVARRVGGRRSAASRQTKRVRAIASPEIGPQIRVWAAANGYDLSERGRIPGRVKQAYEAATTA